MGANFNTRALAILSRAVSTASILRSAGLCSSKSPIFSIPVSGWGKLEPLRTLILRVKLRETVPGVGSTAKYCLLLVSFKYEFPYLIIISPEEDRSLFACDEVLSSVFGSLFVFSSGLISILVVLPSSGFVSVVVSILGVSSALAVSSGLISIVGEGNVVLLLVLVVVFVFWLAGGVGVLRIVLSFLNRLTIKAKIFDRNDMVFINV